MDYLEFMARGTSRIPDRGKIMGNVVSWDLGQAPTKQAARKVIEFRLNKEKKLKK